MFSPFLGEKDASEYNSVAQDFILFRKPYLIFAEEGKIKQHSIMRRKQKLCSLSVDRIVLNHLDQPLCQERMQTVLDLVNDKQCAVLQRLQPAADTGENRCVPDDS